MLKKYLFLALIIPFVFSTQSVHAERPVTELPTQEMQIVASPIDPRARILHDYLAQYNSPLQDYASDFVNAADKYDVDWKLVPAISGVESTFGKQIPGGYERSSTSYNGWGWGVYGDQALYFKSWTDGIYTVTKGLHDNYTSKGITDPYIMNNTYASSPVWGSHVAYFLNDINHYAKTHQVTPLPIKVGLNYYSATSTKLANASPIPGSLNLVALRPQ
jgi:hypothetical protein